MKLNELLSRVIPRKSKNRLFSIVTPCYNAEKYLPTLFANLERYSLDQSLWEVIFIDDGSKDNTISLLSEFCQHKANCKLFTNQHAGVSVARNLGIEHATGEWILFLDCDDWYSDDFLNHLAQAISDYPQHRLFMGEIVMFQEADQTAHPDPVLSQPKNVLATDELGRWRFNILDNNDLHRTAARLAFNRKLVNKYQLRFNPEIEYGEDLLFHWQYILAIKAEQEIQPELILEGVFLTQCTYYYFHAIKQSSRETDRRSKNQTKIMSKAAHGFREISSDYHAVRDFVKHLGSFSYFALLEGTCQKSSTETLEFLAELQYWLEIVEKYDLGNFFVNNLIWNQNFAGNFQHLLWLITLLANKKPINSINSSVNFLQEVDRTTEYSVEATTEVGSEAEVSSNPLGAEVASNYNWQEDDFGSPEQRFAKLEIVFWQGKPHYCVFSNQAEDMEYFFPRFAKIAKVMPYLVLGYQIGWLVYLPVHKVNFFRRRNLLRFCHDLQKLNFADFEARLPLARPLNQGITVLADPEHKTEEILSAQHLLKEGFFGSQVFTAHKLQSVLALMSKGEFAGEQLRSQKLVADPRLQPESSSESSSQKPNLFYRLTKHLLYQPVRRAYLSNLSQFCENKLLTQVSHFQLPLGEYYLLVDAKLSLYAKLRLLDYPNLKLLFTNSAYYQEFTAELEFLWQDQATSPLVRAAVKQLLSRCFVA